LVLFKAFCTKICSTSFVHIKSTNVTFCNFLKHPMKRVVTMPFCDLSKMQFYWKGSFNFKIIPTSLRRMQTKVKKPLNSTPCHPMSTFLHVHVSIWSLSEYHVILRTGANPIKLFSLVIQNLSVFLPLSLDNS